MKSSTQRDANESDSLAHFNPSLASGMETFEEWRAFTDPIFEMIPLENPNDFQATLRIRGAGGNVVADSVISPGMFRRANNHLNVTGDLVYVAQFLRGEEIVQVGDETYTLRPGAVYIRDMRHPTVSKSTLIEQRNVWLPKEWFAARDVGARGEKHRIFPLDEPAGCLLSDALDTIFHGLNDHRTELLAVRVEHCIELLAGLIAIRPSERESRRINEARAHSMRQYLLQRLHDPRVGVDELCERFHCSRATVYRLFSEDGGVHQFLREHRMLRCCDAMTRYAGDARKIGSIAAQWGFEDPSHFSRLFRDRFGVAPRDFIQSIALSPQPCLKHGGDSDMLKQVHRYICRV